ncbi:Amicyanin precursor [Actinomadura rubteroloni]|uniref:Amicyanin n=1 Tax=Actinomadura rubteroloni TaxID=1926885 RepID=A0A2P4UIA4_9ACTN|nr:plastocyanin/azurin family copper-binding protein [Actinomadura rubteroloni]POM24799.1 Amicyanin precursor [Actinomadura rubteroloni]
MGTRIPRRGTTAVLALFLCAPPALLVDAPAASAAALHVRMKGTAYQSANLTVRVGDTVTWTNLDPVPHDVVTTSGPQALRSPLLQRGRSWSYTFRVPGTYFYYCSVHPDMRARVTVQPVATPTVHRHAAPARPRVRTDSPRPRATRSAAPAVTMPAMTPTQAAPVAAAAGKSVNPLLPIAGLVCVVAVFCLLLLTSPASRPDADE